PPALVFQTPDHSLTFAQTQVELIRGPFIIRRAIEKEGLGSLPELKEIAGKEDAIPWISKRLKAGRIGLSEVYEVSFLTREPDTAKSVVSAIVNTYMEFQSSDSDTQRQRMLETLQDELKRLNLNIEQKRKNLRDIAKTVVGDDIPVIN